MRVFLLTAAIALLSCRAPAPTAIDRLSPCKSDDGPSDGYCGKLEVFEDRASASGRKIKLSIVVMPALRRDPRPDPLFVLVGGPGQGAADVAGMLNAMMRRFKNDRDLVLVDQRGTGSSNPLDCDPPEEDSDDLSKMAEIGVERFRDCLKKYDADPRFYTTPIAMDDLEDVRKFLGYGQINVWGGSYGTRAALVYLRQHPSSVRSVILDGVAPPDMKLPLWFARDSQRSLDLMLAACESDPACAARFPKLRSNLNMVLQRLESAPTVELTHPRTGEKANVRLPRAVIAMVILGALYSPATSSVLPKLIEDAAGGNYQGLMALAMANESLAETLSQGMFLSVACAEDYARTTPEEVRRETEGKFIGDLMYRTRMKACEFWPAGKVPDGYAKPVMSDKPVLVLSGELDPVTPPSWGEYVSQHLSNSLHVVVPATGHGTSTVGCVPSLMQKFLDSASTEGLDTKCVENLRRPPFFVNYAGPDAKPGSPAKPAAESKQ